MQGHYVLEITSFLRVHLLKTALTEEKTTVYLFIIKPLIFCCLIISH